MREFRSARGSRPHTIFPGWVVVTNLESSRRQVDRDPSQWPRQAAGEDRCAHPIAGLAHGGVGQPDDREARQPIGDVDLDRNGAPDGAAQRGGGDRCEHAGERSHQGAPRDVPPAVPARPSRPGAAGLGWARCPLQAQDDSASALAWISTLKPHVDRPAQRRELAEPNGGASQRGTP